MAGPETRDYSPSTKVNPLATLEFGDSLESTKLHLLPALTSNNVDERLQLFYLKSIGKGTYYKGLLGDNTTLKEQFGPLDKGIQQDIYKVYKGKLESTAIKNHEYDEELQREFGPNAPTSEDVQREMNRKPNTNTNDFINNLKEMDKPVEVALIDPLDIAMVGASLTELLVFLGKKGGSLVIEKTGEFFIKTGAGKQLIKFKDGGIQMLQKVIEKSGVKEAMELLKPKAIGITTTGERMAFSEATEEGVAGTGKVAGKEAGEGAKDITKSLRGTLSREEFINCSETELNKKLNEVYSDMLEELAKLEGKDIAKINPYFERHTEFLKDIIDRIAVNPVLSDASKAYIKDYISVLKGKARPDKLNTEFFDDIVNLSNTIIKEGKLLNY